jgi:5-methylcytosine-specific restriction endonuclease McrA
MAKSELTTNVKRHIRNRIGKCEKCGSKTSKQVHHIKKVSKGGKDIESNIIVLCYDCHKGKAHSGPLSITDQKKLILKRSNKLRSDIRNIISKGKRRKDAKINTITGKGVYEKYFG